MGVYIKGMKMPRNCEECGMKVICKNYWKLIRTQYTRPSWCPLVLVPPHGRLIDADALSRCSKECYGCPYDSCMLSDIIEDAPTIIPAEEVKE